MGQKVKVFENVSTSEKFDLSELNDGIYSLNSNNECNRS